LSLTYNARNKYLISETFIVLCCVFCFEHCHAPPPKSEGIGTLSDAAIGQSVWTYLQSFNQKTLIVN